MVGQPVLYLGQADVEGIDVPSGDFHDVSVCAVGWEGGGLRLWAWAVLYSGLVYFSIWDEREGRLKADVSDGLDVAMWNNLFIRLGL